MLQLGTDQRHADQTHLADVAQDLRADQTRTGPTLSTQSPWSLSSLSLQFPPSLLYQSFPSLAHLQDVGRATYVGVTDDEALAAFQALARAEGIIPAFESAHAVAHALSLAEAATVETVIVVNLSGRGDKDISQAVRLLRSGEKAGDQAVKLVNGAA